MQTKRVWGVSPATMKRDLVAEVVLDDDDSVRFSSESSPGWVVDAEEFGISARQEGGPARRVKAADGRVFFEALDAHYAGSTLMFVETVS